MASILPLITGAIWLYVVLRYVWTLPVGAGWRVLLAAVLFLVAQYHQIIRRYFGTIASPELPQEALIALNWAFGVVLLLSMILLVRDVAVPFVYLVSRDAGRAMLAGRGPWVMLGPLAMALSAYGVWQAVRVPDVKRIEIAVPGLPAAFDGYQVAQLTDLHASRLLPRPWMDAVVDKTNALKPELIVITGDIQDGTTQARARDVQPLSRLQAPDGVLAIPGNHEYYSDYVQWMQALRALGLTMLENQHVLIQRNGRQIAIAGVTDRQAIAFGQPQPDLQAAMAGIPAGTAVILLDHRPGTAPDAAASGVALQLSGHTHGGQILGGHFLTQRFNNGFVSGLYQVDGMPMYVSNGTGLWNGLALRVGRPSEITLITLRAGR